MYWNVLCFGYGPYKNEHNFREHGLFRIVGWMDGSSDRASDAPDGLTEQTAPPMV